MAERGPPHLRVDEQPGALLVLVCRGDALLPAVRWILLGQVCGGGRVVGDKLSAPFKPRCKIVI